MTAELKQIETKLDSIQSDIKYLKEHLIDVDTILLDDDLNALGEAEEDLKSGKTERL